MNSYAPESEYAWKVSAQEIAGRNYNLDCKNSFKVEVNHGDPEVLMMEGSCNRLVFETWLETCLIANLKPGNLGVIDNASFHHGGQIKALIEAAGCNVMYLPPYSPSLNRIETCWAWIKSRVRKLLRDSCNLREAIDTLLKEAVS